MRLVLIASMSAVLTLPVHAAEKTAHVEDGCGDAGEVVWAAGETVSVPEDQASGYDIKAFWFEDVFDQEMPIGVRVVLQLCGPVPDPGTPYSFWRVSWSLEDGESSCNASVYLSDAATSDGVQRAARLSKVCAVPSDSPLPGDWNQGSSRFSIEFDTVEIADDRITWALFRDGFSGEAAATLEPETVWGAPRADTSSTGATLFWYGGDPGARAGPADATAVGPDYVLAPEPDAD